MQIAVALANKGARATLFAPEASVRHLAGTTTAALTLLDVVDFDTQTSAQRLRDGDPRATEWHGRLPPLDDFDAVVCDNLPEILNVRPDAVLIANFLWHEAVEGCDAAYVARSRELLRRHRPVAIASRLFAAPYLDAWTRPHLVGMFRALGRAGTVGDDILIAVGRGGETVDLGAELVSFVLDHPPSGNRRVHVDAPLLPSSPPTWMVAADFSAGMFAAVGACVCRPGAGTLSDVLLAGGRPFMFAEPGNLEMRDNMDQLGALGLGEACRTPFAAWDAAVSYLNNRTAREAHRYLSAGLNDRGAEETADFLLASIGGEYGLR
jgi:hypothetical protein